MAPLAGFMLPFQGLRLIMKPGLRRFVVMPLLMNIIVFGLLAWLATTYFEGFINQYLPDEGWLSFLRPVIWVLFTVAYALATFYTFTIVANLIASPFNGILAAKVEEQLTGKLPEGAEMSVLASIGPAISGEISKLMYFLKWAIPLLILFLISSFIPGLNIVVTTLWILFGFWFLALEYADYPMGNYDMPPKKQRQRLAKRRFKTYGFGAGVTLMMMIPILWFAAMPAAVAAATRYWVEDMREFD